MAYVSYFNMIRTKPAADEHQWKKTRNIQIIWSKTIYVFNIFIEF